MIENCGRKPIRATLLTAFTVLFLGGVLQTYAGDETLNPNGVNDLLPLIGAEGQMVLGFGRPLSAAFTNDSERFVTSSGLGLIEWTLTDGAPNPIRYTTEGLSYVVRKVKSIPGKNWIVVFETFKLSVYDLDAREFLYTIAEHRPPDDVSISSDGRTLVYYNKDSNGIIFWDIEAGKSIRTMRSEYDARPTFTQDDKRIYLLANTNPAEASRDANLIQVYNIETESIESEYQFTDAAVYLGYAFLHSLGYLTYTTVENSVCTVHIVDIDKQQEILSISFKDNTAPIVEFSPDGIHLVAGTRGTSSIFADTDLYSKGTPIKIYNLQTGEVGEFEDNLDTGVTSIDFSPDGRYFITNGYDYTMRIWSVADKRCMGVLPGFCESFSQAAFSSDGRRVLSCSGGAFSEDPIVRLWDLQRGENVQTYSGLTSTAISVAYAADGESVAAGGADGSVKVWNAQTGEETLDLDGGQKAIDALQFSPDGKTLAAGREDGSIVLWDATSGASKATLRLAQGGVNCMAYSSDGRYLVTGSNNSSNAGLGRTLLWDIETENVIREFSYDSKDQVMSVAFSADGRSIIAGFPGQTAVVWNVETGDQSHIFNRHSGGVFDVSFSPKGDYVSTGSGDNHARIFSLDSEETFLSVYLPGTAIVSKISPDGSKWLVNNAIWDIDLTTPVGEWMMY